MSMMLVLGVLTRNGLSTMYLLLLLVVSQSRTLTAESCEQAQYTVEYWAAYEEINCLYMKINNEQCRQNNLLNAGRKLQLQYYNTIGTILMYSIPIYSDAVLESGSVLESDSSTYFEDSDSDSNPRTRLDSRCSGIGLSTVWLGIN